MDSGNLEQYHSVLLKYAPKREHFSFNGMVARTQLAMLDHNAHVQRRQAIVQKGGKRRAAKEELGGEKNQRGKVIQIHRFNDERCSFT